MRSLKIHEIITIKVIGCYMSMRITERIKDEQSREMSKQLPNRWDDLIEKPLDRAKSLRRTGTVITGSDNHVGYEGEDDELVHCLSTSESIKSLAHLVDVPGPDELHALGHSAQPGIKPLHVGITKNKDVLRHGGRCLKLT